MCKRSLLMLVLGCWLLPTAVRAQEVRVTLGRMVVEVGMPQGDVISLAAAKGYRLGSVPGHENTAIVWASTKIESGTPTLGSIVFEAGKVKSIFKRWTSERVERGVDVGNALFGAASEFVQTGRTACTLETRTRDEPGQQEQVTTIRCGRRAIEVSTVRNDQHRILETSVSELVQ